MQDICKCGHIEDFHRGKRNPGGTTEDIKGACEHPDCSCRGFRRDGKKMHKLQLREWDREETTQAAEE